MLHSFAQNLEDVVLWRVLGGIRDGTYVDVGAADPETDSVTKLFYDSGWSGLHVEPVAEFADRLRAARPNDDVIQACAGSEAGEAVLHQIAGTGLSTLLDVADQIVPPNHEVTEVLVPIRRLDSMLSEAGYANRPIHFLKIDVEGFEQQVISGIDFKIWRPWVILAESTNPGSTDQVHHRWDNILTANDYEFCLFDGLNRFYVAHEHDELKQSLSYPACVFDQPFMSHPHAQLESEYLRTVASYEQLESEYLRTVASYEQLESEYLRTVASYERSEHELTAAHLRMLELDQQCTTLRIGVARIADDLELQRSRSVELESRSVELEGRVTALRTSSSWRITSPLRSVVDFVKTLTLHRRDPASGG